MGDDVLKPGLYTKLGNAEIRQFESYLDEVKSSQVSPKPFVNQDKTFLEVMRVLTSDYPYVVLEGDPGIGKSMILDYTVDILTGDVTLDDLVNKFPKAKGLAEKILKKANHFQQRDYLFLPNFNDPMSPVSISYTDAKQSLREKKIAMDVSSKLSRFLSSYAANERDNIRRELSYDEFKRWSGDLLHSFFKTAYTGMMNNVRFYDIIDQNGVMINLKLSYGKRIHTNRALKSKVKILTRPGTKIRNIKSIKMPAALGDLYPAKKENVEIGLSAAYFPQFLKKESEKVLQTIFSTDVKTTSGLLSEKDKKNFVSAELDKISDTVYSQLSDLFNKGDLETTREAKFKVHNMSKSIFPELRLSDRSIDHLIGGVKEILMQGVEDNISPQLRNWFIQTSQYFQDEKENLNESLSEIIQKIELREAENLERATVLDKKTKARQKQDFKLFGDIKFEFTHGSSKMSIEYILSPHFLSNITGSRGYTVAKIGDATAQDVFGVFDSPGGEIPPHKGPISLGKFFKGGILLFRDSFKDFVQLIANNGESSMRENFLEFLQTGMFNYTTSGVTYKFESPKLLLACDNEDPFFSIKEQFIRDEVGLRSRISRIEMLPVTNNTHEARLGTLNVLNRIMTDRNQFHFKDNISKYIDITDEAKEYFVQSTIQNTHLLSLKYRDFEKYVQESISWAFQNNYHEINLEHIKAQKREKLSPSFFTYVDEDKDMHKSHFSKDAHVGSISGLGVGANHVASMALESYVSFGGKKRFRMLDVRSNLTDHKEGWSGRTTVKGYDLATDYISNLLHLQGIDVSKKANWVLNSLFDQNWYQIGGPSASAAITASMLSALSGEEIYSNRFVTGTIRHDGQVRRIGATYQKSLVPTRLKSDREMYFLYPSQNLIDLSKDMYLDPFDVKDSVVCLPVDNIEQLYYLATIGETIDKGQWRNIDELSHEKFQRTLRKIKENKFLK